MWFPEPATHHSPVMSGLSLSQRHRPLLGPYLQCTFARDGQFVCDTSVSTCSLSTLVLQQLQRKDHSHLATATSCAMSKRPERQPMPSTGNVFETALQRSVTARIARVRSSLSACCSVLLQPYLLLTYLTLVAYWPALWADLVFDDRPAIIENKDLRGENSWAELWGHDYWGTPLQSVCTKTSLHIPTETCSRTLRGRSHRQTPQWRVGNV